MVSEILSTELIRLVAALTSLFLGLVAAAGARSVRKAGDGRAGARLAAAMVALSVAIAAGTWVFISIARRAASQALGAPSISPSMGPAVPSAILVYVAIGFIVGLASGVFPRAVGVPLIVALAASMAIATAALAPWMPWINGKEAARLSILSADGQKTRCVIRTASRIGPADSRDIDLPAGRLAMEFRVVYIVGPLSPFFGVRRYRPSAALAGGARVELPGYTKPFLEKLGPISSALGCSIATARSATIADVDFASASYSLAEDGSIVAKQR